MAAVISLVVVAWKPLDAMHRTPDVSRLLATSPRWLSQSCADRSGRLGGSARPLPDRGTGAPAAHRRPAFRHPCRRRAPKRTVLRELTMRLVSKPAKGGHHGGVMRVPDRPR